MLYELSGSIPPELGNLERLKVLDLTASRTMTRVSISIGGGQSDDGPARGLSPNPTDEELKRALEQMGTQDNRDPISRAIDQIAEQASDPENTKVERNYLSGCIPSNLRNQLDIEASDLGGMPFCDETSGPTRELEHTAEERISETRRQHTIDPQPTNCYSTFDEKDICNSIESGDVEAVRKLLDAGADVNAVDEEGQSRLAMSIATGTKQSLQMIEMLVNAPGADVNVETSYQGTVLNAAITTLADKLGPADHIKVVQALIEAGADVNWQGEDYPSYPPLEGAVRIGNADIVRILIEAGADPRTEPGGVPLLSIASNAEIVRMLVEAGAPTAGNEQLASAVTGPATQSDRNSALASAAAAGDIDQMRMFIGLGADVNAGNEDGTTVLMWAAGVGKNNHAETMRFLIDVGADVKAASNEGWTALHSAAGIGDPESVRILLDAGANASARTAQGVTPLHQASGSDSPETARALLDASADVNAGAEDGTTPLHEASHRFGDPAIAQLLIAAGADVNAVNDHRDTPLHLAVDRAGFGNPEVARVLVSAGANVNAQNKRRETPLAAGIPEPEILQLLLNAGADVNTKDSFGRSVLHQAVSEFEPSPEIVRILLDAGADVNAKDISGRSVLSEAIRRDNAEIIQILVDAGAKE